jgi:hypothetical protein
MKTGLLAIALACIIAAVRWSPSVAAPKGREVSVSSRDTVTVTLYHRWIITPSGERNQFTTELQSTNPLPYKGVTFSDEWTETEVIPEWHH